MYVGAYDTSGACIRLLSKPADMTTVLKFRYRIERFDGTVRIDTGRQIQIPTHTVLSGLCQMDTQGVTRIGESQVHHQQTHARRKDAYALRWNYIVWARPGPFHITCSIAVGTMISSAENLTLLVLLVERQRVGLPLKPLQYETVLQFKVEQKTA